MKRCIEIILVSLSVISAMTGCKKDSKDYTQSIKDKTWWGKITYTGQTTQYYSVHFRSDGTLIWSQLSDNYDGHWVLKDRRLVMNFNTNSVEIKADISDQDKLTNITDNTSFYEVNSGQIVSSSNTSLENTVWKGTESNNGSTYPIQLNFLAGGKAVFYNGSSHPAYDYTQSESGAVIRTVVDASYHIFCILTSGTEMTGSNSNPDAPIQLTKQ